MNEMEVYRGDWNPKCGTHPRPHFSFYSPKSQPGHKPPVVTNGATADDDDRDRYCPLLLTPQYIRTRGHKPIRALHHMRVGRTAVPPKERLAHPKPDHNRKDESKLVRPKSNVYTSASHPLPSINHASVNATKQEPRSQQPTNADCRTCKKTHMTANMNANPSAACPAYNTPRITSCAAMNGGAFRIPDRTALGADVGRDGLSDGG